MHGARHDGGCSRCSGDGGDERRRRRRQIAWLQPLRRQRRRPRRPRRPRQRWRPRQTAAVATTRAHYIKRRSPMKDGRMAARRRRKNLRRARARGRRAPLPPSPPPPPLPPLTHQKQPLIALRPRNQPASRLKQIEQIKAGRRRPPADRNNLKSVFRSNRRPVKNVHTARALVASAVFAVDHDRHLIGRRRQRNSRNARVRARAAC